MGPGECGLKRLIVTADDFGCAPEVNKAIEHAHRHGILTTTSLMIAADAADDAITRARTMPDLGIGLHVVVARGVSKLSPSEIPSIVDNAGCFSSNLAWAGIKYFFSPVARRDLRKEIAAQFDAFKATGLVLDHANAHNHMHLHPTVLSIMIEEGKKQGLKAVRLPQPRHMSFANALLLPWIWLTRRKIETAGLRHNDVLLGLDETGHMDTSAILSEIDSLPDGVSELMTHPAIADFDGRERQAQGYQFEDELAALVDPAVQAAVNAAGATTIRFQDIR